MYLPFSTFYFSAHTDSLPLVFPIQFLHYRTKKKMQQNNSATSTPTANQRSPSNRLKGWEKEDNGNCKSKHRHKCNVTRKISITYIAYFFLPAAFSYSSYLCFCVIFLFFFGFSISFVCITDRQKIRNCYIHNCEETSWIVLNCTVAPPQIQMSHQANRNEGLFLVYVRNKYLNV